MPRASYTQLLEAERDIAIAETMLSGSAPLENYISTMSPKFGPPDWTKQSIIPAFEACRHSPQRICISVPPRHGKKLAHSTPVLTSNGWSTHGELQVGDRVFGPDGRPTKVVGVSKESACDLMVTFSDGSQIKAHREHLWGVHDAEAKGRPYSVKNTEELLAAGVSAKGGTPGQRGHRYRWLVPTIEPLAMPEKVLPVEPYFLGLWLGDGSSHASAIYAGQEDLENIKKELRSRGHRIGAECEHKDTGVVRFSILGTSVNSVIGAKRIPDAYFTASETQRRDLLMGLIDSDGSVEKGTGRVRFVNIDTDLIGDVVRLASTFGYRTTVTTQKACISTSGVVGKHDVHTVQWTPHDGVQQATLKRKDHRRGTFTRRRRSIVSIEKCEPEMGKCITVDNDSHLYLAGDKLIPTHNTYTILHALAKWIKDFPQDTCAYATYNSTKGRSKSKIIRKFARLSGVEFDPSMANLDEWRTTAGGGLLAGGLSGGGLTGEGIQGLLVVDDPIPTAKKAESKSYRDEIYDNFQAVAMTRMEGGSVIVIQTRWHDDDLIGRLKKDGGWTIINLPAIAEANDPLGREVGEPLDPIRYPLEMEDSVHALAGLNDIRPREPVEDEEGNIIVPGKIGIGPYKWSALYQGQPRSKGRKVFGAPYYYDPETFDIKGCRVVIGADPAASEKTEADHSAAVVMAMEGDWDDPTFYILHVWRGQVQIPDFVNVLYAIQSKYYGAHIIVEAVAGFKGVAQTLKRLNKKLKVFETQPRENKFMRAQPLAAAWKAGKVLVPLDAPWLADFYDELDRFTGVDDAEDDQVDAAAHAYNVYDAARPPDRGSRPAP